MGKSGRFSAWGFSVGTVLVVAGIGTATASGSTRTGIEDRPEFSIAEPQWIVPGPALPRDFSILRSNNCIGIAMHQNRLFAAWRSAPSHFASKKTKLFVMSSPDLGKTWKSELQLALGSDVREPFLISFHDKLFFTFFQGGKNPLKFEPKRMLRTIRDASGNWSALEPFGTPGEVPWELKVRGDRIYMTSYLGDHYSAGESKIDLHFSSSTDGTNWAPVSPERPVVYRGGVSEVGFEFTDVGTLWGVTRNEDGDESGWGSQVVSSGNWGADPWEFPAKSDPNRFDSPRMFRHGLDLYLVARRDIGGPYDKKYRDLPFAIQKWVYLVTYSLRPKRTALYKLDTVARKIEWLSDFPSAGDTSFPSIVQTSPDSFLVANYSSPVNHKRWSWLHGQISPQGTGVYLTRLDFKPPRAN